MPLQAEFEVYRNGEYVENIITDEITGEYVYAHNRVGTYTFKEIWVEYPHIIDPNNDTQTIEITEHGKIYELVFKNAEAKGQARGLKLDEVSGQPLLEGESEFTLYTITSLIQNIQADDVDVFSNDFNINDYISIEILKELEPTAIQLVDKNSEYLFDNLDVREHYAIIESNSADYYNLENIIHYIYFEYKDVYTNTIHHELQHTNLRTVGQVDYEKLDSKTGLPLKEGEVEYSLYDITELYNERTLNIDLEDENLNLNTLFTYEEIAQNEALMTSLSDSEGKGSFKDLEVLNVYALLETNVVDKYTMSTDVTIILFDLDEDNFQEIITHTYTFENDQTDISVNIKKIDKDTKEILVSSDLEFTEYDVSKLVEMGMNQEQILALAKTEDFKAYIEDGTVTTRIIKGNDIDGITTFIVNAGFYLYEETNAPKGYGLSDELVWVEITGAEENQEVTIEYYNELLPNDSLPNTGVDSNNMYTLSGILLMLLGLVILIRKKKEYMKNWFRKNTFTMLGLSTMFLTLVLRTQITNADVITDLENLWKTSTGNFGSLLALVGAVITTIAIAILFIVLVVMLIQFGLQRRRGEDTTDKVNQIMPTLMALAVAVALSGFSWAGLVGGAGGGGGIIAQLQSLWDSSLNNIGRLISLVGAVITTIAIAVLVIVLIVMLIQFGLQRRRGEDTTDKVNQIMPTLMALAVAVTLSGFSWAGILLT